jgi:hypothetical protein
MKTNRLFPALAAAGVMLAESAHCLAENSNASSAGLGIVGIIVFLVFLAIGIAILV